MFLHQARSAHTVLDRSEDQKLWAENRATGLSLHFDLVKRESEGLEGDAMHIRYCQQALGSLLWLVARTRPDMAWACSIVANIATRSPKPATASVRHVCGYIMSAREVVHTYVRRSRVDPMRGFAYTSFVPAGFASHRGRAHLFEGVL